ncbi:hypothetical protein [Anaerococcus sp. AGMB09787]|uniref:hypothetical protein n=1 Tax=Anaerococcus sp. AGMB09787 TaxID=2922869 RepID=UPI001FAF755A|nr:hypothetical protein [Anaerococcus sp. AGMB09787]
MKNTSLLEKKENQREEYVRRNNCGEVVMSNCACNNWSTQSILIEIIKLKKQELIND